MRPLSLLPGAAAVLVLIVTQPGCGPKATRQPPTVGPQAEPGTKAPEPTKPHKVVGLAGTRVLMVIAPRDFRDEEYQEPYNAFVAGGAEVTVASTRAGTCTGVAGTTVEATQEVGSVDAGSFDAVVFVGGPGMMPYLSDPAFIKVARDARKAYRLVGAICVAPAILAHADLLKGIPATAYKDQLALLKSKGAQVSDRHVVVTGDIITADGPAAAAEFAQALAKALADLRKGR